jgi:hypothetical protein
MNVAVERVTSIREPRGRRRVVVLDTSPAHRSDRSRNRRRFHRDTCDRARHDAGSDLQDAARCSQEAERTLSSTLSINRITFLGGWQYLFGSSAETLELRRNARHESMSIRTRGPGPPRPERQIVGQRPFVRSYVGSSLFLSGFVVSAEAHLPYLEPAPLAPCVPCTSATGRRKDPS